MFQPGELLMTPDALRLTGWQRESESRVNGWVRMADATDRRQFEENLADGGWTLFYVASVIKATAYGFDQERMLSRAMARIVDIVKRQRHNCLEIDNAELGSFLGIPHITLSAHPRNIQKGRILSTV
jgi:hypothetical protein